MTLATQYQNLTHDVSEAAHRVWLTGLGTLSLVEENARTAIDRLAERGLEVETKGKDLWTDLVTRGEALQQKRQNELQGGLERVRETTDQLVHELENRLGDTLSRLGLPHRDEIETLTTRIEELAKKLDALDR